MPQFKGRGTKAKPKTTVTHSADPIASVAPTGSLPRGLMNKRKLLEALLKEANK